MDQQTTLNGTGRTARDLKHRLGGMARDIGHITELQAQLMIADWRRTRTLLVCTLGCWLTAAVLLLAALPVALVGLGIWLADATRLSVAGGLACTAGGAAVMTAALVATGWLQLRRQLAGWDRTRRELRANRAALHKVLSNFGFPESESGQHDHNAAMNE
jgi:hypothetical protein